MIGMYGAPLLQLLSRRGRGIFYPAKGILAQGAAARGKEINATIGTAYEDDGRPMVLPSVARQIDIDSREVFPYAPSEGLKPLRDKWKELVRAKGPGLGTADISLPVVTCGVTNALSIIGYLFVDEGDEIVLSDLYWENYDLVFGNAYGARLRSFNLFRNGAFDIASFAETINSGPVGKRIVLLNFPNNPTGYTLSKSEGKQIVKVLHDAAAAGNRMIVMLDDSYFGLVFENDVMSESLFAELSQVHHNLLAVKLDGLTKEEYAWGLRVGFVTYGVKDGNRELYKALEDKTSGAVRGNISNSSHLSQSLFLHALNSGNHDAEKETNKGKIRERYRQGEGRACRPPRIRPVFRSASVQFGVFHVRQVEGIECRPGLGVVAEQVQHGRDLLQRNWAVAHRVCVDAHGPG